jgi:hypothetical protein
MARWLLPAAVLLSAVSLHAETAGRLEGRAIDETQNPLPGVTVGVHGDSTVRETVTGADGRFAIDGLPAGRYQVDFRLPAFATSVRAVEVAVDGSATVEATLRVALTADVLVTGRRTFRSLTDLDEPVNGLLGLAEAGSVGVVTAEQIEQRPVYRSGEVFEAVPGVVISQHSGEGKANQYYLRGFNLDHGFDFATTIAGIPVNMPTHAHSQGYADANHLIPELDSGVQFRKGPYYAENGDFSSAGSANINYFNVLDRPIVTMRTGSYDYRRVLAAASPKVGRGNVLGAFEYERDNGPWVSPNSKDKYNAVLRYSDGNARSGYSLTFLGFSNHWHSTDQIPKRAVDTGRIDRFGFIEETDGGETFRYSGAFDWQRASTNDSTRLTAYAQRYGVQLFHNFTYFLNDPENGDQFEQFERRWTAGGKLTRRHMQRIAGRPTESVVGVDLRNDWVGGPLGLYATRQTQRIRTLRADRAGQTSAGIFGETEIEWSRAVRTTVGVRGNLYRWNVDSNNPLNSGKEAAALINPKFAAAFGPWNGTEFYANAGTGFHSNSALGIVLNVDPLTGDPVERSPAFAQARGAEFGVRTVAIKGLQTTATVWYLGFDSELVYVGDSGSTEAGPASRRTGVEITNYAYPNRWTAIDLDVSFSRARYLDLPSGENFIPGALNRVVSAGVAVNPPAGVKAGPFGSFRVRHFGPRSLIEDNSVTSNQTTIVNGEAGYKFSNKVRLLLEGFNLLNARVSDIDYFFESRLQGEPDPVQDIHFHAAIPRSARLALQVTF